MTDPDYTALDAIADVYTPLLALQCGVFIVAALLQSHWRAAALRLLALGLLVLVAYGLMFLDIGFNLWPAFGLDYSTHTAIALVLVVFLVVINPRFSLLWLGSFILYMFLMVHQRYHTIADIMTTIAALLVPAWAIVALLFCRWPFRHALK